MVNAFAPDVWSTWPRVAKLWAGVMMPIVAWILHLCITYPMSSLVCTPTAVHWTYLLVSVATLAMAVVGGYLAYGMRQESFVEDRTDDKRIRAHFMANSGLVFSAWFAVVIIAQTIPMLVIEPCRY